MDRIAVIQDRHPSLSDNQCRSLLLAPYLSGQDDELCDKHFSEHMDHAAVSISHFDGDDIKSILERFPDYGAAPIKCDCCDELIQPELD